MKKLLVVLSLLSLSSTLSLNVSAAWYNDTPAQQAATWDLCVANDLVSQRTYEEVKQQKLMPEIERYYENEVDFYKEYYEASSINLKRFNKRILRGVCFTLY